LESFTSKKLKGVLIFGALAGISTGILGLVWGGVELVFVIIAGTIFIEFLLGKMDKNKFCSFLIWFIAFTVTASPFSLRYSLLNLIQSTSSALCFIIFFIIFLDFLIFRKESRIQEKFRKIKLPHQIISILLGVIIIFTLMTIIFGFSYVSHMIGDIISSTIHPITQGRFSVTVAENQQSYFINDFVGDFGPTVIKNIPLYFWLFFIGAVILFIYWVKPLNKKEGKILTISYILFLICLIFSKYSSGSILNGTSILSLLMYFGGVLFFILSFGYVYLKKYKEGSLSGFKELNFEYILYIVILTIAIIAARGSIRFILILGAVSPVAIGFLIVKAIKNYLNEKEDFKKLIMGVLVLLILASSMFTIWTYYQSAKSLGENYVPGLYQWQWQEAMNWVRENTSSDAVFAHWWDYGYWVQSIGERATILDGGNAIGYWNYFMGRNVLTGTKEQESLDFLYAHNGTHLLIDSTDIGKYAAFSSIGSNGSYDRYSWIPTIFLEDTQTQETNNETMYVYPVGTILDQDYVIKEKGKEILLPRRKAAVVAVVIKENKNSGELLQPQVYLGYNNQQYVLPLKSIYIKGELHEFESGFNGGIYVFPRLEYSSDGSLQVINNGAAFYLSERTINSQLAKLYLFDKKSDYFKLVHSEDNLFIKSLTAQGAELGEFVYYQGLQGPIKIWEISYPDNIKINPDYLETIIPSELDQVIEGEY
jgi:hypothetical protein